MKKVILFGANGMLGRYVHKVLEPEAEVVAITRADINLADYNEYFKLDDLIKDADVIINCAGVVKPQVSKMAPADVYMVNTIFPRYLSQKVYHSESFMLHITTDCVFDGSLKMPYKYNEHSEAMPDDIYGQSKLWGEGECGWDGRSEMCMMRTSIIGEEVSNGRSLLEWAKAQRGQTINGFTNHYWNGLTCLELANYIKNHFITDNSYWTGVRHIYSECVNKFHLLTMINDTFNLNLKINAVESDNYCNRCLDSSRGDGGFIKKPLHDQLKELSEFHDTLYS